MDDHPQTQQRLANADFLKVIGLFCIMLAHSDPPSWLFEVRNFDVPLMVIISSLLVGISYRKKQLSIRSDIRYVGQRILKLVVPTYLFLTFYFCLLYILGHAFPVSYYLLSYALTIYGIGYVWVILIYIYSASLIPVFSKLGKTLSVCLVATAYILYETAFHFGIGTDSRFVLTTIYNIIPYGLLTFLGFMYPLISESGKTFIIICSCSFFLVTAVYSFIFDGSFLSTQLFKYPPRAYYLSYGIFVSFLLLRLTERFRSPVYENKAVLFVSKHSLWIYLWHILLLFMLENSVIKDCWFAKLLVLIAGSSLIVTAQNQIVDLLQSFFPSLNILKYFKY